MRCLCTASLCEEQLILIFELVFCRNCLGWMQAAIAWCQIFFSSVMEVWAHGVSMHWAHLICPSSCWGAKDCIGTHTWLTGGSTHWSTHLFGSLCERSWTKVLLQHFTDCNILLIRRLLVHNHHSYICWLSEILTHTGVHTQWKVEQDGFSFSDEIEQMTGMTLTPLSECGLFLYSQARLYFSGQRYF